MSHKLLITMIVLLAFSGWATITSARGADLLQVGDKAALAWPNGLGPLPSSHIASALSAFSIVTGNYDQIRPALAYNSTHDEFLLVWESDRVAASVTYGTIYGLRLAPSGAPLGSAVRLSSPSDAAYRPDVAYNPVADEYLVVWHDMGGGPADILGQRVSALGQPVGGSLAIKSGSGRQMTPAVACNTQDGAYFVAWTDYTLNDIYGVLVAGDGSRVGTDLALCTGTGLQERVKAGFNVGARQFIIAWADYRNDPSFTDVYAQWVSANGALVGGNSMISGGAQSQEAAAWASAGAADACMVVWQDNRYAQGADVYSLKLGSGGPLGSEAIVSAATAEQCHPDIAYNGAGQYLAVWQDTRHTFSSPDPKPHDIYARCLNEVGQPTGTDWAICTDDGDQSFVVADYATQSGVYLVVWQDNRVGNYDLYGQAVTACAVTATPTSTRTPTPSPTPTGTRTRTPTPTHTRTPTGTLALGPLYLPQVLRPAPPTELAYDDGERDGGLLAGARNNLVVVRCSLPGSRRLLRLRVWLSGQMREVELLVYDSGWNERYTQRLTPSAPEGNGWFEHDLSAAGLELSGEVYVALRWRSTDGPVVGLDDDGPDGRTYITLPGGGFPPAVYADADAMIRLVVQ